MLETIREYAVDRLGRLRGRGGDLPRTRRVLPRHRPRGRSRLRRARRGARRSTGSSRSTTTCARRSSGRFAADPALGAELAAELGGFWYRHTHVVEGAAWLERAAAADDGSDPLRRARILHNLGVLTDLPARPRRRAVPRGGGRALPRDRRRRPAHPEHEQPRHRGAERRRPARARGSCWRSAWRCGASSASPASSRSRRATWASWPSTRATSTPPRRYFRESLEIDRETGDEPGVAVNVGNLGWVELARGRVEEARPLVREALQRFDEVGDREGLAEALEQSAVLVGRDGRPEAAARIAGSAAGLREAIGVPPASDWDRERLEQGLEPVRARWATASPRRSTEGRALDDAAAVAAEALRPRSSDRAHAHVLGPRPGQPDRRVHGPRRRPRAAGGARAGRDDRGAAGARTIRLVSRERPGEVHVAGGRVAARRRTRGLGPLRGRGRRRARPSSAGRRSGLEGEVSSTLPIGTGLSSSAALEVAVGRRPLLRSPDFEHPAARAGAAAQRAELRAVGVPCGIMDQAASLLGREGELLLLDTGSLAYEHVPFPPGLALVILDSGVSRSLEHSGYAQRRAELEVALAALGGRSLDDADPDALGLDPVPARRLRHVVTDHARVRETVAPPARSDRREPRAPRRRLPRRPGQPPRRPGGDGPGARSARRPRLRERRAGRPHDRRRLRRLDRRDRPDGRRGAPSPRRTLRAYEARTGRRGCERRVAPRAPAPRAPRSRMKRLHLRTLSIRSANHVDTSYPDPVGCRAVTKRSPKKRSEEERCNIQVARGVGRGRTGFASPSCSARSRHWQQCRRRASPRARRRRAPRPTSCPCSRGGRAAVRRTASRR